MHNLNRFQSYSSSKNKTAILELWNSFTKNLFFYFKNYQINVIYNLTLQYLIDPKKIVPAHLNLNLLILQLQLQLNMFNNLEKIDEFVVIRKLAQSSNASVYLGQYKTFKVILKKFSIKNLKDAQKEYSLSKKLTHPNIVKSYGLRLKSKHILPDGKAENCVVIIMEYIQKGEIFDFVEKFNGLPEIVVRTYFKMLLDTLQMMHSSGLYHLDIKLENLLLDNNFNLKIIDFGFATENETVLNTYVGTPGYMAPEVQKAKSFLSKDADLFACGVVLFMMKTALRPFKNASSNDIYYYILNKQKKRFWREFSEISMSQDLKDLIQNMLIENPKQRLSLQEVRNHKWMKGNTLSKDDLTQLMKKVGSQLL